MPQDSLSQTRWEVSIDLHTCAMADLYSNTLMRAHTCTHRHMCMHTHVLTHTYTHKDIFKISISQLWSMRLFIYLSTVKLSFSGFRNRAIPSSWSVGGAITHDGTPVPRKVLWVPEPQGTCISRLDCQGSSAVSSFQSTGWSLDLTQHPSSSPMTSWLSSTA